MFDTVALRFKRWRLYRRTVFHLHTLDDRLLGDLGIKRDTIEERARATSSLRF